MARRERDPLPAVELERRHHREQRQRDGERDGDGETADEGSRFAGGLAVEVGRVPRCRDRLEEVADLDLRGVVDDRRLLGRVVDPAALDTVDAGELLLDTDRAGRAGHAVDVEVDSFGPGRRSRRLVARLVDRARG